MSTPSKKRKLPSWVTSVDSLGSKEEPKSATNKGVVNAKGESECSFIPSCARDGPKVQRTGSRPSAKEETKSVGRASSPRTQDAKVASSSGGSGDEDVNTGHDIKEELDAVPDSTVSGGNCAALGSAGVMGEDLWIPKASSERRNSRELQTKVKEEPQERIKGERRNSRELQAKVQDEPQERVKGVPLVTDKSDRRNQSSNHEKLEDMKETSKVLRSGSSREKSRSEVQKQTTNGLDGDGGNYTSATHHVKSDDNRFQQHRNGKVQQMSQNKLQTYVSNDLEEKDTTVHSATQRAESGNCKPLVRPFSKLLEGVVFTISGLVNPERAEIRKMALDMGAEYRPSWSSGSTLLVAAIANTPAFNQVKAVGGTIVHKDWLVECYKRKELVAIEDYMMHVGNPWRAGQDADASFLTGVEKDSPSQTEKVKAHKTRTAADDHQNLMSTSAVDGETKINKGPSMVKNKATRAEVQQWFVEDLETLRSWLEKQHEKPEQELLQYTAAQGLVACLDDAIRSLEENKGLKPVLDAWAFIPRAIKELEEELSNVSRTERLIREAERIKSIYTSEIQKMGLDDAPEDDDQSDDDGTEIFSDTDSREAADYNTDDTEDLDEDEITRCQIQIMRRFNLD